MKPGQWCSGSSNSNPVLLPQLQSALRGYAKAENNRRIGQYTPQRWVTTRMTATRRLAAILAADVAGYSRLKGADEEGTINRLRSSRTEIIDPKITEHRGGILKTTGDGLLVEFSSVVDALHCAFNGSTRWPGEMPLHRVTIASNFGSECTRATSWWRTRTCSLTG